MLLLKPVHTWQRIVEARRGLAYTLVVFLVPLLLLTSAGEGYGLTGWREFESAAIRVKKFSAGETVVYEAAQVMLSLVVVFAGAGLVQALSQTFHGRHTYRRAFILVAYGLSPIFLLRLADAVGWMSPWVTWSVGFLLSVRLLYHGVPVVMAPDPPQAFGLYLMSSVVLLLVAGIARLITWFYLGGKYPNVEELFSKLAAHLPF